MTLALSDEGLEQRCRVCRRPCRRPAPGGAWVLEWRIGGGALVQMEADAASFECEAVACMPGSALPGSYRMLHERKRTGHRVLWLLADAPSAGRHRAWYMAALVELLVAYAGSRTATERAVALRKLCRAVERERVSTRQSGDVDEACARLCAADGAVLTSSDAVNELLESLVRELRKEASALAFAWRSENGEIAASYRGIVARLEPVAGGLSTRKAELSESHGCRSQAQQELAGGDGPIKGVDLNNYNFTGRLGQEPRLRTTQSGDKVLHLNVAVARKLRRGEEWVDRPIWLDVSYYGRRVEAVAAYLRKGVKVAISGELVGTREYGSHSGPRIAIDVVANSIEVLEFLRTPEEDSTEEHDCVDSAQAMGE